MTTAHRQRVLNDRVVTEILGWLGRRRLSQAGLGRELGEHHMWVRRRLNGSQILDLEDLERIAAVLDVDVVELFPPRRGDRPNDRSSRRPIVRRRVRRNGQFRPNALPTVPPSHRRPVPVRPAAQPILHSVTDR